MSAALILLLSVCVVGTSFLSGIFGMAGGMILIGILLALFPVPEAMALHAITQMASNGWRALLWVRYVAWPAVAAYVLGCALALLAWSWARYVPSKPIALLLLGAAPFLVRLLPREVKPNPASVPQGVVYGSICMTLLLLTGVAGPLLDTYFLGGKLDRRQIVATKSMCQIVGHAVKLLYFSSLIDQSAAIDPSMALAAVAASMVGTSLARRVLERMTDAAYRTWAQRLITSIAGYYVVYGAYLLAVPLFVPPLLR